MVEEWRGGGGKGVEGEWRGGGGKGVGEEGGEFERGVREEGGRGIVGEGEEWWRKVPGKKRGRGLVGKERGVHRPYKMTFNVLQLSLT